jgi:glycosyltransferase involved in cell wall biosynthesis
MRDTLHISVVIPACDRPDSLVTCIDSILANDYSSYEIIIVDQSSDDAVSREIERKYSNHVAITCLRSHIKSSSDARNIGWRRAKNELILFTDDDAIVGPTWLRAYSEVFSLGTERIGMAGGRVIPVFQTARPAWLPYEKDYLLPSYDAGDDIKPFPEESLPISVNFALLKSVLEEVGGFDPRLGLKKDSADPYLGGEDSYLAFSVKEAGYCIYYQPSAVVYHPVTSKRLSRAFFLRRNFREGTTSLELENARNPCSNARLLSIFWENLKSLAFCTLLFMICFAVPRRGRGKSYMLAASDAAMSLGSIKRILQLIRKRSGVGDENRHKLG